MMQGFIAGHLGADPEVRMTATGQKVTTFRMAVNVRKQNQDKTVWWRVTVFGDRFEKMMPYIKKGSAVLVFGTMNPPEIYQDKMGNSQISMEIIADSIQFSPFGKSGNTNESTEQAAAPQGGYSQSYQPVPPSRVPAFNAAPAGIVAGSGAHSQEFEDDNLPF
jgi:single-strand DNA-binding protein